MTERELKRLGTFAVVQGVNVGNPLFKSTALTEVNGYVWWYLTIAQYLV